MGRRYAGEFTGNRISAPFERQSFDITTGTRPSLRPQELPADRLGAARRVSATSRIACDRSQSFSSAFRRRLLWPMDRRQSGRPRDLSLENANENVFDRPHATDVIHRKQSRGGTLEQLDVRVEFQGESDVSHFSGYLLLTRNKRPLSGTTIHL